jgi:type IV secretion system protein VirB1
MTDEPRRLDPARRRDLAHPRYGGLSRMELLTLIATCAPMVALTTMKAIVLEESRGHPYAIHDGRTHRAIFPATEAEAVATARRLLAEGSRIDAGLAQISSANWERLGLVPETVFDPCTNLRAGERILLGDYVAAAFDVDGALSRYNTGDPIRGIRNGYAERVRSRMAAQPPDRDYPSADTAPRERDGAPASIAVDPAPSPEGDGRASGESPVRTEDARKTPAWSFVPALDGFAGGG